MFFGLCCNLKETFLGATITTVVIDNFSNCLVWSFSGYERHDMFLRNKVHSEVDAISGFRSYPFLLWH